jgi:hypothetical protein
MTVPRGVAIALAILSMAHVGSPDTFFAGGAGPYRVRVSVRLPGVIPGRAQVAVRVNGSATAAAVSALRVTVRAAQWNVGAAGAPPPEVAHSVAGDPALYASELWLMTPTSYQLFVTVDGPEGSGHCVVPVLALATEQGIMSRSLGMVLAALGIFLGAGMLTIIGAAVRESVLPPGAVPDRRRKRRAWIAISATAGVVGLAVWGGNRWWSAEAAGYAESVLYRPFTAQATIAPTGERRPLTLSIRDPRWTGTPLPLGRYNALMPDHGKLMHLFAIREPSMDAFAHVHPVARTPAALDFDVDLPPLPPGRYRLYSDIVHESGYAQTLVSRVDVPSDRSAQAPAPDGDADDSSFTGSAAADAPSPVFTFADGSTVAWTRGRHALIAREEQLLMFSAKDASGAPLSIEPYMGMSAHVALALQDGSVFAHLHPSGSISMAALQRFTRDSAPGRSAHAMHDTTASSEVSIPYAFPKSGRYRLWVQMRHQGRVMTSAFDADVRAAP